MAGCDNDTPTSPSTTTTTLPATDASYSVDASVRDQTGNAGLAAAVLRILDGPSEGVTIIVGEDGTTTLTGAQGNMNIEATHTGYASARAGVGPPATPGGTSTVSFSLTRVGPWAVSGTGDDLLETPTDLRRVRVTGSFSGATSKFVVWIGNVKLVDTRLGTGEGQTAFSGTFDTLGGVTAILESGGVSWSITQVY